MSTLTPIDQLVREILGGKRSRSPKMGKGPHVNLHSLMGGDQGPQVQQVQQVQEAHQIQQVQGSQESLQEALDLSGGVVEEDGMGGYRYKGRKCFKAVNGSFYVKDARGKPRFVKGSTCKSYMKKIRKSRRRSHKRSHKK